MRRILLIAAMLGILLVSIYLYQRQLGAVSFLLLSIYFFTKAWKLVSKEKNNALGGNKDKREQE